MAESESGMTDFAGPSLLVDCTRSGEASGCVPPRLTAGHPYRPVNLLSAVEGRRQGQCAKRETAMAGRTVYQAVIGPPLAGGGDIARPYDKLADYHTHPRKPSPESITCNGKPRINYNARMVPLAKLGEAQRAALETIKLITGYPMASIRGRTRSHQIVVARMAVTDTLRRMGATYYQIADTLNRDHTTVRDQYLVGLGYYDRPDSGHWKVQRFLKLAGLMRLIMGVPNDA